MSWNVLKKSFTTRQSRLTNWKCIGYVVRSIRKSRSVVLKHVLFCLSLSQVLRTQSINISLHIYKRHIWYFLVIRFRNDDLRRMQCEQRFLGWWLLLLLQFKCTWLSGLQWQCHGNATGPLCRITTVIKTGGNGHIAGRYP